MLRSDALPAALQIAQHFLGRQQWQPVMGKPDGPAAVASASGWKQHLTQCPCYVCWVWIICSCLEQLLLPAQGQLLACVQVQLGRRWWLAAAQGRLQSLGRMRRQ